MFTGNGAGLLQTIQFFTYGVGTIFNSLDNVQFFDAPFSILDVFIAVLLWELVSWYIMRIINKTDTREAPNEYVEAQAYAQYGETSVSSATESQIDFSEEILHE